MSQDLMVLLYGYSWPMIVVGLIGIIAVAAIAGFAVDQRDKHEINGEVWQAAVRRQKALIPWGVIFVVMFMTGWALPSPDYDVRVVEKIVVQAHPYADLFDRCMGNGRYVGDMTPRDAANYELQRGQRGAVCHKIAVQESQRQIVAANAERQRALAAN